MRPRTLDEFVGQDAPARPGPPASPGDRQRRAALADLLGTARHRQDDAGAAARDGRRGADFVAFSAVTSGIKEIKRGHRGRGAPARRCGRRTILFVDEIHRFNKAQQDAFLPHVEAGTIVLVGATTENPSFEVNSALLSRSKVYVLQPLDAGRHRRRSCGVRSPTPSAGSARLGSHADDAALRALAVYANGDARVALNLLEQAVASLHAGAPTARACSTAGARGLIERRALLYDKAGEEHYNIISALHKSMRNSDADAAIYWLARMLEAGEDPLYVARRLVRFASEDIGNADPRALDLAIAAKDAVHFLGMPEGNIALAQAVVYLAAAPKSNAVYRAYGGRGARRDAGSRRAGAAAPPQRADAADEGARLRHGYRYAHDEAEGVAEMSCLPEHLEGRRYYQPTDRGLEAKIKEALERARALREKR